MEEQSTFEVLVTKAQVQIMHAIRTFQPGTPDLYFIIQDELRALVQQVEDTINHADLEQSLQNARESSRALFEGIMGGVIRPPDTQE